MRSKPPGLAEYRDILERFLTHCQHHLHPDEWAVFMQHARAKVGSPQAMLAAQLTEQLLPHMIGHPAHDLLCDAIDYLQGEPSYVAAFDAMPPRKRRE